MIASCAILSQIRCRQDIAAHWDSWAVLGMATGKAMQAILGNLDKLWELMVILTQAVYKKKHKPKVITLNAVLSLKMFNTLRPRHSGRHFAEDPFKHIFMNENVRISISISLKFVPEGPINNIPALVQIMAWRRPGNKPLSEPMMVNLLTHICVTRPQWVNSLASGDMAVVCHRTSLMIGQHKFK